MKPRSLIPAFIFAISLAIAGSAFAEFGALARDDSTSKFGLSSNEETQKKADEVAVKECGSDNCKIVFQMSPKECGAIATAESSGTAWGAGKKSSKAGAELQAMQNCQKRTKGQCKVQTSECNK